MNRSNSLAKELTKLFDLESDIDTSLSVSMQKLNHHIDSKRSSILLFQHWNQRLSIFSSVDLKKQEVEIKKSLGVAGWVFVNRESAVVNRPYDDSRFYKGIDEKTGFRTRNLICSPLIDTKEQCIGTLQSMNKKSGDFTTDDLELLDMAAHMVATAISNSRRYRELVIANEARKKFIEKLSDYI